MEKLRIKSPQGYELINKLIVVNPEERLSAAEALSHQFFQRKKKNIINSDLKYSTSAKVNYS